jgi:hypothetical protein
VRRGKLELVLLVLVLAGMLLTVSATGTAAPSWAQPTAASDIDSDSAPPLAGTAPAAGPVDSDSADIEPKEPPVAGPERRRIDVHCPNLVMLDDERVCQYAAAFPRYTAAHR